MITDHQYSTFLERLLADQRGKNSLLLTDWERKFLSSYSAAYRGWQWFTEGRRNSVEKMWRRYGAELNFPHPLDAVPDRPMAAPAQAGCCQYLVKDDETGRERRCNVLATCREPGRMLYCDAHGRHVAQRCQGIVLIPYRDESASNPRGEREAIAK